MPIPTPNKEETKDKFVTRCVEQLRKTDSSRPLNQILAICYEEYRKSKK
jgi:hypothetical protein